MNDDFVYFFLIFKLYWLIAYVEHSVLFVPLYLNKSKIYLYTFICRNIVSMLYSKVLHKPKDMMSFVICWREYGLHTEFSLPLTFHGIF